MSVAGILVLTAIVVLSVVSVFVAEEPLDTVVEVEAAMTGMNVAPLSSKVATASKQGARVHRSGTIVHRARLGCNAGKASKARRSQIGLPATLLGDK